MKKLFTLVALLAVFLGAKAEWVEDVKQDYSTYNAFPFYVMGFVPEFVDGVMTDYGAMYSYLTDADMEKEGALKDGDEEVGTIVVGNTTYHKIHLASAGWHQYHISGDFDTEIDGSYTVKAMVRASEACTIDVDCAWDWNGGQKNAKVSIGTEWTEVEWTYDNVGGSKCWVTAKPGTCTATIEWKYVIVGHNQKAQRPQVWMEWLNSDGQPFVLTEGAKNEKYMGDAETAWPSWATENAEAIDAAWRGQRTGEICAWGKTKGRNEGPTFNDATKTGYNPFPADIEADPKDPSNKVFVVHGAVADTDGDAAAWDNQFWIQSPKSWKSGDQIKVRFRYMCSKESVKTQTQIHKQNPSEYLIWHAIGDVTFTNEWQQFEKVMTIEDDMATGWSIAFNLNANDKEAIDFYFDDLCWQTMKLDEGYFIAGANPDEGLNYDFDNAIQFVQDPESTKETDLFATVGEKNAYVSEVMISTIRGNDASFKTNTLKPKGSIELDEDDESEWLDLEKSSLAKVKLPASGIWNVYLDLKYNSVQFVLVEGVKKEASDIVTNKTHIVVHGQERDDLADGTKKDDDGNDVPDIKEEEGGTGQAWDNQFFIKANRKLSKGEATVLTFKYKASKEAKTTTQCHGENPGAYIHWAAIGDVTFTTEWQDFYKDFTIPAEGDGTQCIAFNMAEIREACDYEITDVQWYMKDDVNENGKTWENLIDETGTANFFVKEGAGTEPHQFGGSDGINNVVTKKATSNVTYNLAGQRVSKDFKGIVIKNGQKFMNK